MLNVRLKQIGNCAGTRIARDPDARALMNDVGDVAVEDFARRKSKR